MGIDVDHDANPNRQRIFQAVAPYHTVLYDNNVAAIKLRQDACMARY